VQQVSISLGFCARVNHLHGVLSTFFTFFRFAVVHVRMLLPHFFPFFVPFLLSVVQFHLEDAVLVIS